MTAVVGILNKYAVAIAADSAVTIESVNGDNKIFNKANKVFSLSKYHPVGIMLYNSASFMNTPWEIIIKVYRKELGDKSFPTLKGYQEDFIDFLRRKKFYTDEQSQKSFLENFSLQVINLIMQTDEINYLYQNLNDDAALKRFEKLVELEINEWLSSLKSEENLYSDFEDYTLESFLEYSSNFLREEIYDPYFIDEDGRILLPLPLFEEIEKIIFFFLRSIEKSTDYTGLIFTGFGEDEIYPQLIPVNISIVVDNRLRYYIDLDKKASISNTRSSAICPFAQTDVIDTILQGVDPALDETYVDAFAKTFHDYNEMILNSIEDPLIKKQVNESDIKAILDDYIKTLKKVRQMNYINPLMRAVARLAKEDLAEMAESLIYLTYLKRRITFAEESVGGPVDVAIISKGDGFIWIKRKHYFRPELNQRFFDNYFKN